MKENIAIRSEKPADYKRIAEIHAAAFTYQPAMSEVVIVDVLRHSGRYDAELSLIAEIHDRIVGHVLFHPHEITVDRQPLNAVALAPIAVHPDYQNRGVGGRLIEEGHRRKRCAAMGGGHDSHIKSG